MSLVNVARAIRHPGLRQSFTVERQTGAFQGEGRYVLTPTVIQMTGIVQPTSAADRMNLLPEGQRQSASISIWSTVELRVSDGISDESDVVIWQGGKYRLMFVKHWELHGYWFAIGVAYTNA